MPADEPDPGGWRAGLRVGAGLAASAFALAISFGAVARAEGWSPVAATVFSLVAFSGSAQFAVLASLAGGSGPATAIGAATLMNLRFLPMAAATARSLHGGRWQRGLEAQAVVDGSWVSAYLGEGRFDRGKLLAATAVQWPAWVLGTALGAALGLSTDFIEQWGLDVIFPAYFFVLLVDTLSTSRSARPVAAAAAVLGAVALLVAPAGIALVASSAAALLVLLLRAAEPPA